MNKAQLSTGVLASILALAALFVVTLALPEPPNSSTYLLIGWVAGMVGLFSAGSV